MSSPTPLYNTLSICSLTPPPRSNVRLFSVIFLIVTATILFFVNVIVVLQHSLSPILSLLPDPKEEKR